MAQVSLTVTFTRVHFPVCGLSCRIVLNGIALEDYLDECNRELGTHECRRVRRGDDKADLRLSVQHNAAVIGTLHAEVRALENERRKDRALMEKMLTMIKRLEQLALAKPGSRSLTRGDVGADENRL